MLLADQIHYLIEQEVNVGSFIYRDREPDELDDAINTMVFDLTNLALDKKEKERTEIEKLLLQSLTKKSCQTPVNNKVDLPTDYTMYVNASTSVIRADCCKKEVTKLVKDGVYQSIGSSLYDNKWYENDEVIIGKANVSFYGRANQVTVKPGDAVFIDSFSFESFPASLTSTYYTIIGKDIELRSRKLISSFCLNYVASITDDIKIDSCNDKTLKLPENIQRWVIKNTILKLMIVNEESQQKIANLKS